MAAGERGLHQPPLEQGNLRWGEYLTDRLPEEWKAGNIVQGRSYQVCQEVDDANTES